MEDIRLAGTISLASFALVFMCWFGTPPTREPVVQYSALARDTMEVRERERAEAMVVDRAERELRALEGQLDRAIEAVVDATTAKERDSAKATLETLERTRYELARRLSDERARSARTERLKGWPLAKECLNNPLLKGCI